MSGERYDVAIVGASLAGVSCGLALAGSGLRVLLVDKEEFPRRKPCGEGLGEPGVSILQHYGIFDRLEPDSYQPLKGFLITHGKHRFELPFVRQNLIGVQRHALDFAALRVLEETRSAQLRLGTRIISVRRNKLGFRLNQEVSARVVVLAEGVRGKLAREIHIGRSRNRPHRFGISALCEYSSVNPLTSVSIIRQAGFEVYCTPVGGCFLNVAFLGARDTLPKRDRIDFLLTDLVASQLGCSLKRVSQFIGSGSFPQCTEGTVPSQVLLVGDTLEAFDPIGGMGMSHALLTGSYAGKLLGDYFKRGLDWDSVGARYQALTRAVSWRFGLATRLARWSIMSPIGKPWLWCGEKLGVDRLYHLLLPDAVMSKRSFEKGGSLMRRIP